MQSHTAGFDVALEGAEAGGDSAAFSSWTTGFSCLSLGAEVVFLLGGATLRDAGAADPTLHLTVAFSKASFILAFRMSAILSIVAFSGLSPTIFMR